MTTSFSSKRALSDAEEIEIQHMIASDPDNPEINEEQIASARPFREALPLIAEAMDREIARRGRPKADHVKQPVTLRLDLDVINAFKATGKGWQSRMNEALRKAVNL